MIPVDPGNSNFVSVDGVLYNAAMTTLVEYPAGKALTTFTIPGSVTSIGGWAFGTCSHLTSITVPNGVTSIGVGAFSGCYALTSVNIPDGVTSIEGDTFVGCALTSITIPDSVTSIGPYVFWGCTALTQMHFEGNAPVCGDSWIRGHNADLIIYYYYGATGFTNPWYDVPTVCIYPVELSITPPSATVEPGNTALFTVTVTNPGTMQRTLGLALDTTDSSDPKIPLEWFTLSANQIVLEAGASATVTLSVAIPSEWAAVENVMTSVLVSVTNELGTRVYNEQEVGLTVIATELSAIYAVHGTTVDIVLDIEQVQAKPTQEGIDMIRSELVHLISMIQKSMDNGLLSQENGQALLASANAALSSVDRSDVALDQAKMKLVGNALETAQNQLNALVNKLRGM